MYSNASYVKDMSGAIICICVLINGQQTCVPLDPANIDYANLMELEREGKIVIQPADGETE
jgi:hypothetical protein